MANKNEPIVLKLINMFESISRFPRTNDILSLFVQRCHHSLKRLPVPFKERGCVKIATSPPLEGLGEASLGKAFILPAVLGALHSPLLLEKSRE